MCRYVGFLRGTARSNWCARTSWCSHNFGPTMRRALTITGLLPRESSYLCHPNQEGNIGFEILLNRLIAQGQGCTCICLSRYAISGSRRCASDRIFVFDDVDHVGWSSVTVVNQDSKIDHWINLDGLIDNRIHALEQSEQSLFDQQRRYPLKLGRRTEYKANNCPRFRLSSWAPVIVEWFSTRFSPTDRTNRLEQRIVQEH